MALNSWGQYYKDLMSASERVSVIKGFEITTSD
jgi:hypothetical protein